MQNWRDCKAWSDAGLRMSSSNNEACKLYDAVLSQYVGWYEDHGLGGIENCVAKMIEADPNFVMGHVMSTGLDLLATGSTTRINKDLSSRVDDLIAMSTKEYVLDRERKHAHAVKLWADGYISKATDLWEDIIIDNPCDMLAIKFCHDSYVFLGHQCRLRDSIARVLPHWNKTDRTYGYLLGMYSFGLVETNLYDKAEKTAKRGLEMNKNDSWSTHSLAHVFEMTGRFEEGKAFMKSTENNWSPSEMLACHLYWHTALYDIEQGNYGDALGIFDMEVGRRVKSGALLEIVDACSLLFRLELEGVNVKERWEGVFDICQPHSEDHVFAFNDVHILMACLGCKNDAAASKFLESMQTFADRCVGDNATITKEVGLTLCQSLVAYANQDYEKAVELLLPIRYEIIRIGFSDAQRDIFKLYLIVAALKSSKKQHKCLARQLLLERKAFKENAPMTDRLMARAMSQHIE